MAQTKLDPFHWDTIVEGIRRGSCVPFLGAGVNASAKGYSGLPLGGEVAARLLARLVGDRDADVRALVSVTSDPLLDDYLDLVRTRTEDLARVALHVQVRGSNRRLVELIEEILQPGCEPSPLLSTLADTPVRLVITTNYDDLMEEAYRRAGSPVDPLVVVQPIRGFSPKEQISIQTDLAEVMPETPAPRHAAERPVVYKIHGALGDTSRRLIISEEDYIEFLDTLSRNQKGGVPNLIRQVLVDNHLLFLGYGLEDWDFRTLWKGLVETVPREHGYESFAIQKDPPPFWERFWDRKNVTIYNVDLYEFADELKQRLSP